MRVTFTAGDQLYDDDYYWPQCSECQKWGHWRQNCHNQHVRYPYCSDEHTSQQCNKSNKRKCINCGGDHCSFYKKCPQFKAFYLWFQDKNNDTLEDTKKTENGFKDMSNEIHEISLSRRFEMFQEHIRKVVNKRITDALNDFEKKIGMLLQNLLDSISGESINQKINSIVNVDYVSVKVAQKNTTKPIYQKASLKRQLATKKLKRLSILKIHRKEGEYSISNTDTVNNPSPSISDYSDIHSKDLTSETSGMEEPGGKLKIK
ncbi:hypothetical protein GJ496_008092 [Pomphorhynchus laevis]|nr:hypothetical protein GJ496_008092 [Pomphorhynchus laevis]